MKNCSEVSKITGVSVRTLHHYDAIGLLKPAAKSKSGYRLYDDGDLSKLQVILLLKELDFSLNDIKNITGAPDIDLKSAVAQQAKLLTAKKERLEKIIALANNIVKGNAGNTDFLAFDRKDMERYKEEVKEKWGNTGAYKEYEKRHKDTAEEFDNGLMNIFAEIGMIKDEIPESEAAKGAVLKLQRYITDNYYTCTDDILKGLGEMYVSDERFRENIDSVGGKGTAEFTNKAIKACIGK